jgi:hypothetical protein
MAKSNLARPSFKIGYMNLMDSRLLSQVDLSPAPLLSEHSDSFTKLRTHIRGHSSSINLVEALYLVDALSMLNLEMLNSNAPSGSTGLSLWPNRTGSRGHFFAVKIQRIPQASIGLVDALYLAYALSCNLFWGRS